MAQVVVIEEAGTGKIDMLAATSDREKSRPQARGRHDGVVSAARRMNGDRGRVTQFLTALHGSRTPMVVVDNHRRYIDANGAARLLFRMSLGEFRRRQIDELTPREGLARMELLWSQLLAQGEVSGDYDVRFEDGSQLEIVFSALANVLPGQHLIVFAPASWPPDELGVLEERRRFAAPGPLSVREREVLTLIAEGHPLPEIAERLTISLATVRTHAANVYRKLGARNRPHAVALALRRELIAPAYRSTDDPRSER